MTKERGKKKRNTRNDNLSDSSVLFYLLFAISLAALMRGDNVRRGSDNLKNGCYLNKKDQHKLSHTPKKEKKTAIRAPPHLQQLSRTRPLIRIHLQTLGQIIRKHIGQILGVGNLGSAIGRNQIQRLERILVQIRRFTFNHLNSHNAQTPNVHFGSVFLPCDNFRSHPVRGTNHSCTFGICRIGDLCTETKVGCLCGLNRVIQGQSGDLLSLISPAMLNKTLSLLISRWITPCRCKCSKPWVVSLDTAAI